MPFDGALSARRMNRAMSDESTDLPRFLATGPCAVGRTVTLAPQQSRHLAVVLRLGRGDRVRLFTGDGREFTGRIEKADAEGARVAVEGELESMEQPLAPLILGFAPAPAQRSDVLIEKAAELGASRLQPVLCERTQGDRVRRIAARRDRWERKAQEAARQSGRAAVPEVGEPVPFDAFVRDAPEGLRIIATTAASEPVWRVLAQQKKAPGTVTLAVGPAGGFTRREQEAAVGRGFMPVSLGPSTLRVETAAICLLAAVVLWLDGRGGAAG